MGDTLPHIPESSREEDGNNCASPIGLFFRLLVALPTRHASSLNTGRGGCRQTVPPLVRPGTCATTLREDNRASGTQRREKGEGTRMKGGGEDERSQRTYQVILEIHREKMLEG